MSIKETLKKYSPVIEAMVKELYEKEVIEGKRVRELIEAFESGRLEEEIKKENSENKEKNKEDEEKQNKKEERDANGNNS